MQYKQKLQFEKETETIVNGSGKLSVTEIHPDDKAILNNTNCFKQVCTSSTQVVAKSDIPCRYNPCRGNRYFASQKKEKITSLMRNSVEYTNF